MAPAGIDKHYVPSFNSMRIGPKEFIYIACDYVPDSAMPTTIAVIGIAKSNDAFRREAQALKNAEHKKLIVCAWRVFDAVYVESLIRRVLASIRHTNGSYPMISKVIITELCDTYNNEAIELGIKALTH